MSRPAVTTRAGWYRLNPIPDHEPGTVRHGEEEIVVWRSDDGVHALEDWCPHRGAHLGAGTVDGGTITCPLHGWRWAGDGRHLSTPDGPPVPGASCRVVPTADGARGPLVWLARDPGGPDHDVVDLADDLPEVLDAEETHWIDLDGIDPALVIENAFDLAHVPSVHGQATPTAAAVAIEGDRAVIEHRAGADGPTTRFTAYRGAQLLVRVGTSRPAVTLWVLFTVDAGPRPGASLLYAGQGPGAAGVLHRFARHHRRELAADLSLFATQRPDRARYWGPGDDTLQAFRSWLDGLPA